MIDAARKVIDHTDSCPQCSRCEFCDEGKRLLDEARRALAERFSPDLPAIPPIRRSPIKA